MNKIDKNKVKPIIRDPYYTLYKDMRSNMYYITRINDDEVVAISSDWMQIIKSLDSLNRVKYEEAHNEK